MPGYVDGSYEVIGTREKMVAVVSRLARESVVGIDIENHHVGSYEGFICLV